MHRRCVIVFVLIATNCWFDKALALDFACMDFRPTFQDRQLERPKPPDCVAGFGQFNDEFEFERCRSEMTEYQTELRRYGECLVSEQNEAIGEYNETVRQFNNKASSQ